MKLVIEVPNMDLSDVKVGSILNRNILNAVKNGTPLPKHHGKLKDADELYNIFQELCDAYNIDNLSFKSDMDMNFDLAPTIIEANKESK